MDLVLGSGFWDYGIEDVGVLEWRSSSSTESTFIRNELFGFVYCLLLFLYSFGVSVSLARRPDDVGTLAFDLAVS